jgi:uncharacterized membrane protein
MTTENAAAREERIAQGLGWFSNALAVAQLVAPGRFARAIGSPDGTKARLVIRGVGAREAFGGFGLLRQPRPAGWAWARVAGDAMDLALLVGSMTSSRARRGRLAAATGAVAGIAVVDAVVAQRLTRARATGDPDLIRKSITVNGAPDDVYAFWRDFGNLPRFMFHLESVEATGDDRSRWRAKAPAGKTVEWEGELVDDQPGRRIAWRSLPGSSVDTQGSVEFRAAPGDRGTEVHVELRYRPPGGPLGTLVATLFGEEPEKQLHDDLRRFKQVLETGEVVRSEGTPAGQSLVQHLRQRAAQPLGNRETSEGRAR